MWITFCHKPVTRPFYFVTQTLFRVTNAVMLSHIRNIKRPCFYTRIKVSAWKTTTFKLWHYFVTDDFGCNIIDFPFFCFVSKLPFFCKCLKKKKKHYGCIVWHFVTGEERVENKCVFNVFEKLKIYVFQ